MTAPHPLRSMDCPSCGAPLDYTEDQTIIKCKYCNHTLERPRPAAPPPPPPRFESNLIVEETFTRRAPRPMRAVRPARRGRGCLAVLSLLLLMTGLGAAAWLSNNPAGLASLNLGGLTGGLTGGLAAISLVAIEPAALVASSADAPPNVVVETYNTSDETRALAYLSPAQPALLWRAAPLSKDSYSVPILADAAHLYTVDQAQLLAIQRADGQPAWRADLSDLLAGNCDCLRLLDGRLVALSADGNLQAFDAASGQPLWNKRLQATYGRLLILTGKVAVVDQLGIHSALLLLDPASGQAAQTLTPTCSGGDHLDDDFYAYGPILPDPAGQRVYLVYGFFKGCVQAWNLASGQMEWQTLSEDTFGRTNDQGALLTPQALYLSQGSKLVAVDLAGGQARPLLDEPDYELLPLAAQDGQLLVRARRTRGTEQFELWSVQTDTGERRWSHSFKGGGPLDEPDRVSGLLDSGDDPAWTWRLTPAGVRLLQAQADPHQLLIETLNLADGVSGGQTTIRLSQVSGSFYAPPTIFGWTGNTAWLVLESHVYGVDTEAAHITYVWP